VFCIFVAKLLVASRDEKLKALFEMFDLDRDNFLIGREIDAMLEFLE
jgi:hypothetical protein